MQTKLAKQGDNWMGLCHGRNSLELLCEMFKQLPSHSAKSLEEIKATRLINWLDARLELDDFATHCSEFHVICQFGIFGDVPVTMSIEEVGAVLCCGDHECITVREDNSYHAPACGMEAVVNYSINEVGKDVYVAMELHERTSLGGVLKSSLMVFKLKEGQTFIPFT